MSAESQSCTDIRDSTVDSDSSLSPSGADYVRHNAHTIANLPPAGERWTLSDLRQRHEDYDTPMPDHQSFAGWEEGGILERVGSREFDDGNDRAVWTVTPVAHSRAQSIDESTPHLGCCPDATGFRNLGDDEFECTNDACNATHSRERIKEVFMGGGS